MLIHHDGSSSEQFHVTHLATGVMVLLTPLFVSPCVLLRPSPTLSRILAWGACGRMVFPFLTHPCSDFPLFAQECCPAWVSTWNRWNVRRTLIIASPYIAPWRELGTNHNGRRRGRCRPQASCKPKGCQSRQISAVLIQKALGGVIDHARPPP